MASVDSLEKTYQKLLKAFHAFRLSIQTPMPIQTAQGTKIYETAKGLLGVDASPNDEAPDALACAETVNAIVKKALGAPVGGGASTFAMWQCLRQFTARWEQVLEPLPGDIVISPTGASPNARLQHGHVGIVAKYGILSNNSENGLLSENWDMRTWKAYYSEFGGLPTLYYRCIA